MKEFEIRLHNGAFLLIRYEKNGSERVMTSAKKYIKLKDAVNAKRECENQ